MLSGISHCTKKPKERISSDLQPLEIINRICHVVYIPREFMLKPVLMIVLLCTASMLYISFECLALPRSNFDSNTKGAYVHIPISIFRTSCDSLTTSPYLSVLLSLTMGLFDVNAKIQVSKKDSEYS